MKQLKIMGVCAGSGAALLFPFVKDSRFKVIGNVEPRMVFHTINEENWRTNFPMIPFLRNWELPEWKPDVIVSSPDCGASSIMRLSKKKELGKPNKNASIRLVFKAIKKYKPQIFLMENLPRLLNFISRERLEKKFKDYELIFHIHSVMEFGNSQKSRERLIIVGIRKDSSIKPDLFRCVYKVREPKITSRLLRFSQCKENYQPKLDKVMAMYDYRKLPEKKNLTVAEIHNLWNNDFKDEYKWPIKTSKMNCLPGVYRLKGEEYPLTVRPSDRQFRPDGYPLGIKDFQVIMGIPLSYQLHIPTNQGPEDYNYFLNKARYALCKGSVYEVGEWFKKGLLKKPSSRAKKALEKSSDLY